MALNSHRSTCLCLPSAGIKGLGHHTPNFVHLVFKTGSLTGLELAHWASLDGVASLGICLSSYPAVGLQEHASMPGNRMFVLMLV